MNRRTFFRWGTGLGLLLAVSLPLRAERSALLISLLGGMAELDREIQGNCAELTLLLTGSLWSRGNVISSVINDNGCTISKIYFGSADVIMLPRGFPGRSVHDVLEFMV